MTKKVLLIDDEKDFTELTSTLLHFNNLGVETVNHPKGLDEALAKGPYDVIVTDLMMPEIDGFQIVERLRGMEEYASKPIIVLSAKTLTDAERKLLLQRQVHFVGKPFEPHALVEQIVHLAG